MVHLWDGQLPLQLCSDWWPISKVNYRPKLLLRLCLPVLEVTLQFVLCNSIIKAYRSFNHLLFLVSNVLKTVSPFWNCSYTVFWRLHGNHLFLGFRMDECVLFGNCLYMQAALDSLHFSNIFWLFVFRYVDGYEEISTMSNLQPSDSMSGTTWACLRFPIGLCVSWVSFWNLLLTDLQSRTCCPWVTSL